MIVQDKVKQRNITPNFLRFRSICFFIKEKVRPIPLGKKQWETIALNLSLLLKELIEVLPRLADAAFKHINLECFISANLVSFL